MTEKLREWRLDTAAKGGLMLFAMTAFFLSTARFASCGFWGCFSKVAFGRVFLVPLTKQRRIQDMSY